MPEQNWIDRLIEYTDKVRREVPAWVLQSGRSVELEREGDRVGQVKRGNDAPAKSRVS
jgi:hypothetical protein